MKFRDVYMNDYYGTNPEKIIEKHIGSLIENMRIS